MRMQYEIVKNIFYKQLRTSIEQVPSHNFLIILSNMNARMRPEDVKYTYDTFTTIMEVGSTNDGRIPAISS